MGIYSNGTIYGIKIYTNIDNNINILLNRTYDAIINDEQKREIYLFYTNLNDKQNIFFQIYTECSSTYDEELFMSWYPIDINFFLKNFETSSL